MRYWLVQWGNWSECPESVGDELACNGQTWFWVKECDLDVTEDDIGHKALCPISPELREMRKQFGA